MEVQQQACFSVGGSGLACDDGLHFLGGWGRGGDATAPPTLPVELQYNPDPVNELPVGGMLVVCARVCVLLIPCPFQAEDKACYTSSVARQLLQFRYHST